MRKVSFNTREAARTALQAYARRQDGMSSLDAERLSLMQEARQQRRSKLLRQATGEGNMSAAMNRVRMGIATSALLTTLLGAGIGGLTGAVAGRHGRDSVKKGLLYGAGAGAATAGILSIIGGIAGQTDRTPHKQALSEYANAGSHIYTVPGLAAFHEGRLNNALIDLENDVERPKQYLF